MRKTDRKIDNALCQALTIVCEKALETVPGFKWLTHRVDYARFPESLAITCVFDSRENLTKAKALQLDQQLSGLIQAELGRIDIMLPRVHKHLRFDTQEDCEREHFGKWQERL